jgi:hypothetical protein
MPASSRRCEHLQVYVIRASARRFLHRPRHPILDVVVDEAVVSTGAITRSWSSVQPRGVGVHVPPARFARSRTLIPATATRKLRIWSWAKGGQKTRARADSRADEAWVERKPSGTLVMRRWSPLSRDRVDDESGVAQRRRSDASVRTPNCWWPELDDSTAQRARRRAGGQRRRPHLPTTDRELSAAICRPTVPRRSATRGRTGSARGSPRRGPRRRAGASGTGLLRRWPVGRADRGR